MIGIEIITIGREILSGRTADTNFAFLARALQTPLVRFGGNYTSGYHWRDGIGPIDKRVSMLNQATWNPAKGPKATRE